MRRAAAVVGVLMLSAPVFAAETADDRIADLQKRVEALERQVRALTEAATPALAAAPVDGAAKNIEPSPPGAPAIDLVTWDSHMRKGDFSNFYRITYVLKNNYEKPIKVIDGSLQFTDLLGEVIYTIRLTKDAYIGPGKQVSSTGDYGINQFLPGQDRMGGMPKTDIIPKIVVRSVVFGDNTIAKFSD